MDAAASDVVLDPARLGPAVVLDPGEVMQAVVLDPARLGPAVVLDPGEVMQAVVLDPAGLVPAVVQQHDTGEVLMVAWMNEEALRHTLATGRATYFSRSRNCLWVKGETSGHHQRVVSVALDCDGDTLLVRVDQTGPACHTGERTCFHRTVRLGNEEAPA